VVAGDIETLTGGSGDDTLTGDGDANTIDGGGGFDTLAGGTATAGADGADVFIGGVGRDRVSYANRTTPVFASIDGGALDGNDCPVTGPCEKDNIGLDVEALEGGSGNDTLIGDSDGNTLVGNGGDDELEGGTTDTDGSDVLSGGDGSDRVVYNYKTSPVVVTLGTGADGKGGCPSGAGCEDDVVPDDVEEVIGSQGADTLTGNASANELIGAAGDDVMSGGTGTGNDLGDRFLGQGDVDTVAYTGRTTPLLVTIDGTANDGATCPGAGCENDDVELDVENVTGGSSNDTITGDLDINRLDGAGGDDVLAGGGTGSTADGADQFIGGPGAHDRVTYGARTVPVTAVAAAGSFDGIGGCPSGAGCEQDSIASDTEDLTGGQEDDSLSGNSSSNVLDGQGGDDLLEGAQASSELDGADTFIGGTSGTAGGINGSTGDLVDYSRRDDDLVVSIGGGADGGTGENDDVRSTVERVTTGDGADRLTGDGAVNALIGGAGNDTIAGGAGAGPDGADVLQGGSGTGDTISYASRTDGLAITINGASPDGDQATTFEHATGGSGNDTITGTTSPNTLTGGLGSDNLNGLGGADRLEARDGVADTLDCGTEGDVAVVDFGTLDTFTGCEMIIAPAAPPPDPDPDPPVNPDPDPPVNPNPGGVIGSTSQGAGSDTPAAPAETGGGASGGSARTLSLGQTAATLTASRTGQLTVTVQAPAGTQGRLTIATAAKVKVGKGKKAKRKIVTLATARFRVGASGLVKVPVTLSASNRKLLASLKKVKSVVTATAPRLRAAKANLTIKAPKPRKRR
jgi:Ca2+-binding RTX toxin-like protein